jgi:hypothetical protein
MASFFESGDQTIELTVHGWPSDPSVLRRVSACDPVARIATLSLSTTASHFLSGDGRERSCGAPPSSRIDAMCVVFIRRRDCSARSVLPMKNRGTFGPVPCALSHSSSRRSRARSFACRRASAGCIRPASPAIGRAAERSRPSLTAFGAGGVLRTGRRSAQPGRHHARCENAVAHFARASPESRWPGPCFDAFAEDGLPTIIRVGARPPAADLTSGGRLVQRVRNRRQYSSNIL